MTQATHEGGLRAGDVPPRDLNRDGAGGPRNVGHTLAAVREPGGAAQASQAPRPGLPRSANRAGVTYSKWTSAIAMPLSPATAYSRKMRPLSASS